MINKNEALKIAIKFLNDDNLKISSYAENNNVFIFQYEYNNRPVFDNSMIQVDKITAKASNYIITEHLEELNKMKFQDAN